MVRYLTACFLLAVLLVACDSGSAAKAPASNTPASAQSGSQAGAQATITPAAAQSGPQAGGTARPTAATTPNNVVATPLPGAANDSFQTARMLGKDPVKFGVKESELYYKIDVARGGIISATLTVESGSPAPAKLSLYNELQEFVQDASVPVGKSGLLRHVFNRKGGGIVFLSVRGESNVVLSAQALTQNDGGSGGDAADDADKPTVVALGTSTGVLGDDDGADVYAIDLPKTGGVFQTSIKTSDGSMKAVVDNEKQDWVYEVAADKNEPAAAGTGSTLLAAGQGGRWFVSVRGSGGYTLTTSFGAQNDAASGKDAPDDIKQALLIKPGAYSGIVGGADTDDYFAFDLAKTGGVLTVLVKTADGAVKGTAYDDGPNWVAEVTADKDHANGAAARYVIPAGKGGKWFLDISGDGSYAFTVTFTPQNDGGSGKDAGDNTAAAVTPKTSDFTGTLGDADESDYFKITAAMGRKVSVKFVKGEGSLRITLYDKDGTYLKDASAGSGQSADLTEDSGATTDYFVEVRGASGDYSIKVSK